MHSIDDLMLMLVGEKHIGVPAMFVHAVEPVAVLTDQSKIELFILTAMDRNKG